MSLQDSPSLEEFKDGLEAGSQKNKSPHTRRIIYILLVVMLGLIVLNQVSTRGFTLQQGTAAIAGTIVDENGQRLPAKVMVFGTNIQATANAKGEFMINNVPPGNVLLVVGYHDTAYQHQVYLEPGETLRVGELQYTTTQVPGK